MAKRAKPWSYAMYRNALTGGQSVNKDTGEVTAHIGLRKLVNGFDASAGYDLHDFDNWTPYQKKRVREWNHRTAVLMAQSKRIYHTKDKKKLNMLHDAFHGDIPSKQMKVALIPYTEPQLLPGAKKRKIKVRITKSQIVVDDGIMPRRTELFNKIALVTDTVKEVQRAAKVLAKQGVELFFVQTGEFQTTSDKSPRVLANQIAAWISKYDGVKPLKGKRWQEKAENHFWGDWLHGLVGYAPHGGITKDEAIQMISRGRLEAQQRNKDRTKFLRKNK